jgi:ABC-type antimicrobial peptide transport system permease subunit
MASLGAFLLFNVARFTPNAQFFPYMGVEPPTFALSFGVAAAVGTLGALIPAIRATRRPIVEGLRFVG